MNNSVKPIIYQLLPRLFANYCENTVQGGKIEQNGSGKMNDINAKVLSSLRSMGVTHVWYTGVIEHAHKSDYSSYGIQLDNPYIIKGEAGSPYAITDYYDIDPDIAVNIPERMNEFESLVKRTHEEGMKVIIDFVPNHVARQYRSDAKPAGIEDLGQGDNTDMFFSPSNNFYYITRQQFSPSVNLGSGDDAYIEFPAKASGNDCFNAFPGEYDWYDTVKLNYGVDPANGSKHFDPIPPTWMKMLHILRFWASKGVDGFRCDMVHMVPLEFWNWAIQNVRTHYPDVIFIAEIYDVALYRPYIGAGFNYLYDKVNLYDTLRGIETGGVSAAALTSSWQTVDGIAPNMLNFLENHDEQRFASEFYCGDPKRALASLVVSSMISTGPMMIYMGQELGEAGMEAEGYSGIDGRTTIFDYWSIPSLRLWLNKGKCNGKLSKSMKEIREMYSRVLKLCNAEKAISIGRFYDLMYVNYDNYGLNPHRHFAFLRNHGNETLVIICNFSDIESEIEVNIPRHAFTFLDLPEGIDTEARELISGDVESKIFTSTHKFSSRVKPHGAVVWKIDTSRLAPVRKSLKSNRTIKKTSN